MTKKYWKDWQQRFHQTENIYRFDFWPDGKKNVSLVPLLWLNNGDRIKRAKFVGDCVAITVERHEKLYDNRTHVHKEFLLFKRTDIGRIIFKT